MMESVIGECKQHQGIFASGQFFLLQETPYQQADFLLVGWLVHLLAEGRVVTLIAFRENYAHFLALSRKLGKSIEGFLKSQQLVYIECFQHQLCSQLPLCEPAPSCYSSPPSNVHRLSMKQLLTNSDVINKGSTVIVDAICFLEEHPQVCFWIHEQAANRDCRLIMGGCLNGSDLGRELQSVADLVVRMENDVNGYGKFTLLAQKWSISLLWRLIQGSIQISQHMKI